MNTLSPAREAWLSVFGLGHMRPFSGTWGSLPPVVAAGALAALSHTGGMPMWVLSAAMVLGAVWFTLVCVLFGTDAEARWGKDPSAVVADEVAGQCVTIAMVPFAFYGSFWSAAAALVGAFLLFRAFDILKPWPAGAMQKIPGGWGVVLDDLIAGVMAGVVVWIVHLAT